MEKVYKYRGFEPQWSLDILTQNKIWFSCPNVFNDPFDCRIPVHFEDASLREVAEVFTEVAIMDDPGCDRGEVRRKITEDLRRYDPSDEKGAAIVRRRFGEALNRLFGIVSLSAVPDDLLMWAHYGDAHRGFCVGLDVEALEPWMERHNSLEGREIRLAEVTYAEEMPYLNPGEIARHDLIFTTVSTKAHAWSYEREYRLLGLGLSNEALELDQGIISEVIAGHAISEENLELLIEALKARGDALPLYRARTKDHRFALELYPVSY